MAKVCYKAWVQGTVQGVGFRYSTQAKANTLNVQGYARNLEDGRVEVRPAAMPNRSMHYLTG